MIPVRIARSSFLLILLVFSGGVAADSASARDWLRRISQAGQTLSFDGVFVYQHAEQLQSMRIVRKLGPGKARERLVSLNGAGREVIRNGQELLCYLPDTNSVLVEQRKSDSREFPNILPGSLEVLDSSYRFELGPRGRVANRAAQSVLIRPNDTYRYGYRLWADQATGLLLMASLLDSKDAVIEQFMFTQLKIGGMINDADFEPATRTQGLVYLRENVIAQPTVAGTVVPGHLPAGFNLSARFLRQLPPSKVPLEHMVYTDGLAVVSVFVQRLQDGGEQGTLEGMVSKGAAHVFGRRVDGHHVTIIGEVPAPTVRLIGDSLALARAP